MKYIFMAGAPGSKWSSVSKHLYYSPSIDRSDYSEARTYYHDASGTMNLMHMGAYFDPGMEFNLPEDITTLSKAELEEIFNSPFTGTSDRIIKSHIFSDFNNINYLKKLWPDSPIVLVHRDNDSCLGWWVKCGHFDITYPTYNEYYVDLKRMARLIEQQNLGITKAWDEYPGHQPIDNVATAYILGIDAPPKEYHQVYARDGINVKII